MGGQGRGFTRRPERIARGGAPHIGRGNRVQLSTMSERWRRFKEDTGYRWRELLAKWRALPKSKQWQIAGGLCAAAALSMSLAVFYVTRRGAAAHPEETNAGVVLYTSVDSNLVKPITDAFEEQMRIHVLV